MKVSIALILTAITVNCWGQVCNNFTYFKKGAVLEMTSFDHKDKIINKTMSTVTDVKNAGNSTEASMDTKTINAKGKEQFSAKATVKCAGNSLSVSMKNMMNSEQMAGMKDMEMKVDETYLDYPANMKVGSNLKDGNFKADFYNGGMKLMSMNLTVSDRKVVAQEDIETPAGKFNCYKLTYKGSMKTIVNMSYDVAEWFSPKYGVVKSETYRNGKSMGYSILTRTNM